MHSQSRQRRGTALRIGVVTAFIVALAYSPAAHAIRFWGEEEEKPVERSAPEVAAPEKPAPLVQGLPNFADLAEALQPAVVNISTTTPVEMPHMGPGGPGPRQFGPQGPQGQGPQGPGGQGDPFHEFWEPFERYFGPMPRQQKQRSLGSGFILDRNGLIMTNNHVVENAEEIIVQTSSDKEYKAKVVG